MSNEAFYFAPPASSAVKAEVAAPQRLMWTFNAQKGLDKPFHGLVSMFGDDVIMALDQIILETPIKAAVRATKVFQHFYAQMPTEEDQTREVMAHMADILTQRSTVLDDVALLPPEAVFAGHARPRG